MPGRDGPRGSVLFVCIENSSRSIMAEAFAKRLGLDASSAGTVPAMHVNPLVIEVMKEVGMDVSQSVPRPLTGDMIESADVVVLTDASLERSMPGNMWKKMRRKVLRWSIPDPQGASTEEVRFIRDMVRKEVAELAGASPSRQA